MWARPLSVPLLAMCCGLALSGTILPYASPLLLSANIVILISSCFLRSRIPFIILLFSGFLIYAALSSGLETSGTNPSLQALDGKEVLLDGVVISRPRSRYEGNEFDVRIERISGTRSALALGNVRVSSFESRAPFRRGDLIRISGRLKLPRLLGLPGEFDYPQFLKRHHISALVSLKGPEHAMLLRGAFEDGINRRLDGVAAGLADTIRSNVRDKEISAVLVALLLGDQSGVSRQTAAQFTRAGVNHILSISGFHIGVVSLLLVHSLLFILLFFQGISLRTDIRRLAILASVPVLLAYLVITGSAAATARAVIMFMIACAALWNDRETDPVNLLVMSAFILIVPDPAVVFDISFQLSFIALWGVVAGVQLFSPLTERFEGITRYLLIFLAASVSASAATAVPVLYHFKTVSFAGILSNFLIVPLLGYGAVITGFAAMTAYWLFQPLGALLFHLASALTGLSLYFVSLFEGIPVFETPLVGKPQMTLCLLFIALMSIPIPPLLRRSGCIALLLALLLMMPLSRNPEREGMVIDFFSIGQGDSSLVRFPDGKNMLVDGGGSLSPAARFDTGERYLYPALREMGVRRIDYLVMTHSHPDHYGGLTYILDKLPVNEFWCPEGSIIPESVMEALKRKPVKLRRIVSGEPEQREGGVRISFLSPHPPLKAGHHAASEGYEEGQDENDRSLMMRIEYGDFSVLLPGDSGFPAENRILSKKLHATVLKVAHHGSRFSTSDPFLEKVSPKAAVISAGFGNSFGLPSRETLSQLEKRGVQVFRTDTHGTVTFRSDGSIWSATSFFP